MTCARTWDSSCPAAEPGHLRAHEPDERAWRRCRRRVRADDEPARRARAGPRRPPGRVDLAVEIPLPDRDGRRRLFDLYARGLDLAVTDRDAIVDRTEGVTASFVKELLRKAALVAAEAGHTTVTDADLQAALDELMTAASAMTRVLLGVSDGDAAAPPADMGRAWLRASPGWTQYRE